MNENLLTIVYDNELHDKSLKSGHGFSCLVGYSGRKILFDTGDDPEKLSFNMEKLGISYDVLKKINPGIVCASISGFGHYGPYKDRPGYDIIGQAVGGLMSVTGWPDSPPTRTGTAMGDVLAGLNCLNRAGIMNIYGG